MSHPCISFVSRIALTLWLAASCSAPPSCAQTPPPLPRIAVLPDDDDRQLATFADLLTVSLSQAARGCELVERAELNRLSQEAEIQNLSAAERPRALARFAKADGLILLSLEKSDPKRPSIIARLSAASSGLIHKSFMLAAEEKDLPEAAKLAAEALRFPAERLSKAGSPPPLVISLLGFRATVANSPGVAIETALNGAVTHHLSSIPGLAVVERWKLDDIAFERSLAEKDMPALTTGTTLVDGSFEIKDTIAAVKLRIRTTQKDQGKTITVEGPANDALALARNIATKVAEECGNHVTPTPWDMKAEANAYAKLAAWLLDHRMGREATQAYESAVALGDDSPGTLLKRIYAYILVAQPKHNMSPPPKGFDEFRAFIQARFENETDAFQFVAVLRIANRFVAYTEHLLAKPWKPYPGCRWTHSSQIADNVAIIGCRVLTAAHRLNVHTDHYSEVATLREGTAFLAKLHEKNRGVPQHTLDLFAGYWLPTPEEAVEHWLDLLSPDPKLSSYQLLERRNMITNAFQVEGFALPHAGRLTGIIRPQIPVFVDWSKADNARGEACWRALLERLRSSKMLLNQADSFAFAIYTTPADQEREKLLDDYLALMERNRQILTQPQGQVLFYAYEPRVRATRFPPQFAERYAGLVETMFGKSDRVDSETLDPIILIIKMLLGRFSLPTESLQTVGNTRLLPKENALKLLHTIEGFRGQIIRSYLVHSTTTDDLLRTIRSAYPDLNMPAPLQPVASKLDPDAIAIRCINLKTEGNPTGRWLMRITGVFAECGDRILCNSTTDQGTGFASIDKNCIATYIPPPSGSISNSLKGSPFAYGRLPVPTTEGFFTVSQCGMLLHYSYQDKKWTDKSNLLPAHLRNTYQEMKSAPPTGERFEYVPLTIGFINNILYIGTSAKGHTIGRVVDGRYELIASSRRNPAEHPVDEAPPSTIAALFPGTNGRPYALLHLSDRSEVHDLELKKKVGAFTPYAKAHFDGKVAVIGTAFMVSTIESESEKPRNLVIVTSGSNSYARIVEDRSLLETVWDWPRNIPELSFSQGWIHGGFAVHGDCLFYLKCAHSADTHARVALGRPSTDTLSLLCFKPGRREPLEIPLGFQPDAKMNFQSEGATPSRPPHPNTTYDVERLQATSAGLFFNCNSPTPKEGGSREALPSVLCVTWKDVNDWLKRHGHSPIGTRTATEATLPSRR